MFKPLFLAAIWKAADLMCSIYTVGCAYYTGYGTLRPETGGNMDEMLRMLKVFCAAMVKGGANGTKSNGRETFVITFEMCNGFVYEVTRCGLKSVGIPDGDYIKLTAEHFKKMLL